MIFIIFNHLQQSLKIEPIQPHIMQPQKNSKQLGNQQFKKQNYSKAIEHYRQYIEMDHQDNIQAMSNIALCYFKQQQYEHAIEACDQALAHDEKYVKCYYRRALSRKELLKKDKTDKVQKYKLYYDSQMFKKYNEPGTNLKQIEQMTIQSNALKQEIMFSQPIKITPFLRDLLQIEKDNINLFALSWLQNRKSKQIQKLNESKQFKINNLYKQLIKANRQIKDPQEQKTMRDLLKDKIKQMHSTKKNYIKDQDNKLTVETQPETNEQSDKQQQKQTCINNSQLEKISIIENKQQTKGQDKKQALSKQLQINVTPVNSTFQKLKQSNEDKISKNQTKIDFQAQIVPSKINKDSSKQESIKRPEISSKNKVIVKEIEEMSNEQIYKHYFGDSFKNSKDHFSQFGISLQQMLSLQKLPGSKVEELLVKISKSLGDFKLLIKNIPKQQRAALDQKFAKFELSQQVKKVYLVK